MAGKRKSFEDPRGGLVFHFLGIVQEARPPYFIMENVKGLMSAKDGEGRPGGALRMLDERFKEMGYTVAVHLVNSADYGVPQQRERAIFIGSRDGQVIDMLRPSHPKGWWRTLGDALLGLDPRGDLREPLEFTQFPPSQLKYLAMLRAGQNWRDLPPECAAEAMGGAYHSGGGKVGFFRRLAWDKPCPTLMTSPTQKATCLCHPDELRPLSVREYARVQEFSDDWQFAGDTEDKYRLIGNAVPTGLGFAVGQAVLKHMRAETSTKGEQACPSTM